MQFRLFDTPVRVQPWFLLIAVFLGYSQVDGDPEWIPKMAVWVAVMFVGVLAHEYGHAVAGRLFGLKPRIELHGMGGLTSWENGRMLSPGRSMVVSAAGPAVGIVVGVVTLVGAAVVHVEDHSVGGFAVQSVIWVNLGWGVLNLVPMMPLDGGNLMASFFELFASGKGRIFARWLSLAFAAALVAFAVFYQQLYLAILCGYLGYINWRGLSVERKIGADLPLAGELRDITQLLEKGRLAEARTRAQALAREARTPLIQGEAQHLVAWSYLLSRDPVSAQAALDALPPGREVDPALAGAIRLANGDAEGAITPLSEAMARGGTFVADNLAAALIATRRWEDAVALFGSPRAHGLPASAIEKVEEAAYRAGEFRWAAGLGEVLFEREGRGIRAFNTACSLARAGDGEAAMRWLERARGAGLEQPQLLDDDEDLASLRRRPDWSELRASFDG